VASSLPNSAGHLLQLLRSGTVTTRRELREVTDLSRSTVSSRVEQLISAGLVREVGTAVSSGGRPATILMFDEASPTILVADIGATHGRVAVTDAGGRVLAEKVMLSRISSGPEPVLTQVCDHFDGLLTKAGRSRASICGIGIGLPGPVDFEQKVVVRPPLMPGWHRFGISQLVGERFDAPVLVDNDANLMALGEQHARYPDAASLVFVKVGTGIGAGIVLNGALVRGAQGAEGHIGHVRLEGSTRACTCGATGCLAASASGGAIVAALRERGLDVSSIPEVISLVSAGDSDALATVNAAGRQLGDVLATVVALLNPDVLVLGGDLGSTEHLLQSVHQRLLQRSQPLATRRLVVASSELGDRAGVAGAVEMVRGQVFSAVAVDARLAPAPARPGPATRARV
jgi:predicted NBD/HSP70 family sugar kinase